MNFSQSWLEALNWSNLFTRRFVWELGESKVLPYLSAFRPCFFTKQRKLDVQPPGGKKRLQAVGKKTQELNVISGYLQAPWVRSRELRGPRGAAGRSTGPCAWGDLPPGFRPHPGGGPYPQPRYSVGMFRWNKERLATQVGRTWCWCIKQHQESKRSIPCPDR